MTIGKIKKEILLGIADCVGLKHSMGTKTSFLELYQIPNDRIKEATVKWIIELKTKIDHYIPGAEGFQSSKTRGVFRRKPELSAALRDALVSGRNSEGTIEKFIIKALPENVFNQFSLLSGIFNSQNKEGRTSIDLIDRRRQEILRIIELKDYNNKNDNPFSTMIEVMAYYFIYQKMCEIFPEKFQRYKTYELIVLAPEKYYYTYNPNGEKESDKVYRLLSFLSDTANCALADMLNNTAKLTFRKYDIPEDQFRGIVMGSLDLSVQKYQDPKINENDCLVIKEAYLKAVP